jgi:hypothetical protein
MISEGETECLKGLYQPTNLKEQYNQKSPNPYPALMVCGDKLIQQNKDIELHYLDYYDGKGSCTLPFNVRNLTSAGYALQEGYARNIDVDSELKRINHYGDKCYYDKYKIHPQKVSSEESALACHADVLVKNYDKDRNRLPMRCMPKGPESTFKECPYMPNEMYKDYNEPVHYAFSNDNYCRDWPCQKLFHNQTKRSTLTNLHNRHDINPEHLSCVNRL